MRYVQVCASATALAVATALGAILPLPAFGDNLATSWDLRVRLRSGTADELLVVSASVFSSDGKLVVENNALTSPTEPVRFSTSRGETTFIVSVTPDSSGAATALQVVRGGAIIYASNSHVSATSSPPAPGTASTPAIEPTRRLYSRVIEGITPPKVLGRVEPVYPEDARKARVRGMVILEARIDETGIVRGAEVVKNLPFGLGEAALNAVRQWTFTPALQNGKPLPIIFNVTMNFTLGEDEAKE